MFFFTALGILMSNIVGRGNDLLGPKLGAIMKVLHFISKIILSFWNFIIFQEFILSTI